MKCIVTILFITLMCSCKQKEANLPNRNVSEIVQSLTERSIGEYSFESLLIDNGNRPSNILGIEVRYFQGEKTYMPDASTQVLLQFSKMGLNVPVEHVAIKVKDFTDLKLDDAFGQIDYSWRTNNLMCYVAVHTDDDIFELSCWK